MHDFDKPLYNCGILGGRLPLFRRLLGQMALRVTRHHTHNDAQAKPYAPVDMFALNEILLDRKEQPSVVTGFPLGPVNLPMFSTFCGPLCFFYDAECTMTLYNASKKTPRASRAACTKRLLANMLPDYFFVHKISFLTWGRSIVAKQAGE